MRKATFVLATLVALGACLTLFGNDMAAASGAVPDTCQARLAKHYHCYVVNADGDDFNFCVTPSFSGGETFNLENLLWRDWLCECEAKGKLPHDLFDTPFGTSRDDFVCGAHVVSKYCSAVDQPLCSAADSEIAGGLHGYFQHGLNLQGVFPFYCNAWCPFSFVARCEPVDECRM